MASGLPISCSDRGPMPEILKKGGLYFDPENINSIIDSLDKLILSDKLRSVKARLAYNNSLNYSWKKCSDQTFLFLKKIIKIK